MTTSGEPSWQTLPAQVQRALTAGWNNGVPAPASALYSRWWQLETWLRSLVYVELRSAKGSAWADELVATPSADRQQKDEEYRHMPSPDAQDQLAYLDAGPLLQLTLDQWPLFRLYLPAQKIWAGKIEELKAIRNRIGHCRRPHGDDLDRLEQTLRDLDPGAFLATSSFNDQSRPNKEWSDVLVKDWGCGEHPTADRLISHAESRYDTSFTLLLSRRPWAEPLALNEKHLGPRPGYVWHAVWYFRGGRSFDLSKFWRDLGRDRNLIMLVCADSASSLQVSFSALDDQKQISDIIGRSFDAALTNLNHWPCEDGYFEWGRRYENVDPRVHAATPWAGIDPSMHGVTLFSA